MLVLTRKLNEQISIGDDVKITLIRVRGNTVRIGIEAPKDIRIVRGELEPLAEAAQEIEQEGALSDREHAFAHPQADRDNGGNSRRRKPKKAATPTQPSRSRLPINVSQIAADANAEVFVGTVKASGAQPMLARAPLAHFVSAS